MRKIMISFAIFALGLPAALPAQAGAFEDGAAAYRHGDYRTAMTHWGPLSSSDPTIQNNYGIMYKDGKGVRQDYAQAAQWFSRSAAAGSSLGQNNLGGLYRDGKGVPRDYGKALTFFQAAAQQGNPGAQINLGLMEMNGQGVAANPVHAYMWFDLAASRGLALAASYRSTVRQHMSAGDIATATQLAQQCRATGYKNCG
jgi:hypothetical protein